MLTKDEIDEAYNCLKGASVLFSNAAYRAAEAKADLERKTKAGLADGTIAGKNADMREAAAAEVLAAEVKALADAQAAERVGRLELDLARAEVGRVQAVLRLMEVAGSVESTEAEDGDDQGD